MTKIPIAVVMLVLAAGCVTRPDTSEPPSPTEQANQAWLRGRELYYRNQGWNGPDAMFQAEQDLEAGNSVPADRPPMERRPSR